MKKKLGIIIFALAIAAGAFVYAGNKDNSCPDRPDCICSKQTTTQVKKPKAINTNTTCPNTPNCICKE